MLNNIARKLVIGAALAVLATPGAFAGQTGADPEPGVVHTVLVFLGLA